MNEGGRLVAELVGRVGAAEFGRRVRTSEAMVRHLATGRKAPGADLRERIRQAYGVPLEAWSMAPKEPKEPKGSASRTTETRTGAVADSRGSSGLQQLRDTIGALDRQLALVEADPLVPARDRTAVLRAKADAADRLARLQGEGELTMAAIVRSRVWRELLALLGPVLDRHPDAAAEIADVLERIEGP